MEGGPYLAMGHVKLRDGYAVIPWLGVCPGSSFVVRKMVTIAFSDRETEKRALAFLIGRFSGRVLRSEERLVPKAASEDLADQNIPFTVPGKATYEQRIAAIRGSASSPIQ